MKKSKLAFTFVELIIVLVILTILSTIGFVSYESYLSTGRDTNRIGQLRGLHQSLSVHGTKSNLPIPHSKIDILSSTKLISYQGDLDNEIASTIAFRGSVYDEELDIFPSYVLSENRKDFQIMTYLEDASTLQTFSSEAYAFTDFLSLYPTSIGKPLGLLFDADTLEPIHIIDTYSSVGNYDIISGGESLTVYIANDSIFDIDGEPIIEMIPNQSCKKILELGKSKGNGEYVISPTGTTEIRTYCDMTIDGGGWTFTAYVDENNTSDDLFSSDTGTFRADRLDSDTTDLDTSYSIDASTLDHREMMVTLDNPDPIFSNRSDKIVFFNYGKNNELFYSGPLPCTQGNLPTYRAGLSGDFNPITILTCNSNDIRLRISGENILRFANGNGAYWYTGISDQANNSSGHSAWIYVR